MNSIEEIKRTFESKHSDSIQLLIEKRKSVKLRFTLRVFIVVGILIGNSLYFNEAKYFIGIFILFFGFIYIRNGYRSLKASYSLCFRENIVSKLVHLIDEQLHYFPEYGISKKAFLDSGLTKEQIDRYQSTDYFEGEIDGVPIRFAEVLAESMETGEGSGYNIVFQGIYFQADFHKTFASRTVIFPDVLNGRMRFIGEFLAKHSIAPKNAQKVNLEDPRFRKHFVVYSHDQVEARYILTPSMMERISKFREKHQYFSMSFADGIIHIGLFSDKTFRPPLFGEVVTSGLLRNYVDSIELAVGIVEDLKVNPRY